MKRTYLCAALLLCAAACAPAPADNTNSNSNANASNMNAANSNTAAAAWTNDDVISNERQAWDSIKTKNSDAFAATLDDNFINVTSDGVYTKAQTVAEVKTFDLTDVTLSDFKVVKLDNDAAVVAYTVNVKGGMGGHPLPANAPAERHGTAKVWRGGKWLAVYHQVTPVEPPMATPGGGSANANAANANAANANTANSNGAATAASPATLTPTADAEANERMIWDAFQKKNIAGFESVLTEDNLEVEPDAVYDRAASVESVRQMVNSAAFKGITLSDFKTVALDEDAKVVTYVGKSNSKGAPPAGMRHSTIWVNRGGKWMVAYHQGTTITTTIRGGM